MFKYIDLFIKQFMILINIIIDYSFNDFIFFVQKDIQKIYLIYKKISVQMMNKSIIL